MLDGTFHCFSDGVDAEAGEIVRSVALVERDLVLGRRRAFYTSQNNCRLIVAGYDGLKFVIPRSESFMELRSCHIVRIDYQQEKSHSDREADM